MLSPSNQPRWSAPLIPVPWKYSCLARNATLRGAHTGMTTLSAKLRWLLASSTPPDRGTLSRPTTVGRQIARATGGMTDSRIRNSMGLILPVTHGSPEPRPLRADGGPPLPQDGMTNGDDASAFSGILELVALSRFIHREWRRYPQRNPHFHSYCPCLC